MHQMSKQAIELFKTLAAAGAINKTEAEKKKAERIQYAKTLWLQCENDKGLREVVLISARLKQTVNVNTPFDAIPQADQLKISDAFHRMFNFVHRYKPLDEAVYVEGAA